MSFIYLINTFLGVFDSFEKDSETMKQSYNGNIGGQSTIIEFSFFWMGCSNDMNACVKHFDKNGI